MRKIKNFLPNTPKIGLFSGISTGSSPASDFRASGENRTEFGNFISSGHPGFSHERGIFSLMFAGSLLLHLLLGVLIAMASELWVPEPPPIRARIGVRIQALPPKPTLSPQRPSATPASPTPDVPVAPNVPAKLKAEPLPELRNPAPPKAVVKKPTLEVSPVKPTLPTQQPLTQALPDVPVTPKSVPETSPAPDVPAKIAPFASVIKPGSAASPRTARLPQVKNKSVPPSPITSNKSKLTPTGTSGASQIKIPQILPVAEIPAPAVSAPRTGRSGKILKSSVGSGISAPLTPDVSVQTPLPEFSKTTPPSLKSIPEFSRATLSPKKLPPPVLSNPTATPEAIIKPSSLEDMTSVPAPPLVQDESSFEPLLPEGERNEEPPAGLVIPKPETEPSVSGLPKATFLQRKRLMQEAEGNYNLHIQTQVIPKLGGFSSDLYVRIKLTIMPNGEIVNYQIVEKSGSAAFDQAAMLAVRNAVLNPLPKVLAKNPPYIVLIKIIPQTK